MPDLPVKSPKAARRRLGPGDEEENFLSRWSQRKEAVRAGEELVEPDDKNLPAEILEDRPEEDEEIDLDSLPDIETLDGESDFSLFMKKGIPDELRNKALRKLWRTDPVLANVDGLVDYGEDFTGDGLAGKAFKTAWKLGQGFLTDEEVRELRGEPEEDGDDETIEVVQDESDDEDETTESRSTENENDVTG